MEGRTPTEAKFYETGEDEFEILTHWVAYTVVGAPHSQNLFEHQQRQGEFILANISRKV